MEETPEGLSEQGARGCRWRLLSIGNYQSGSACESPLTGPAPYPLPRPANFRAALQDAHIPQGGALPGREWSAARPVSLDELNRPVPAT